MNRIDYLASGLRARRSRGGPSSYLSTRKPELEAAARTDAVGRMPDGKGTGVLTPEGTEQQVTAPKTEPTAQERMATLMPAIEAGGRLAARSAPKATRTRIQRRPKSAANGAGKTKPQTGRTMEQIAADYWAKLYSESENPREQGRINLS